KVECICPHDIVLKVPTVSGIADVCPICGKTIHALSNHKGRLIEGGPRLDFSSNAAGMSFIAKDSRVVMVFQQMIVDAAKVEPGMNIFEFIRTIPEEMYVSEETINQFLKQRCKKKD
ncbi:MAG TPA: hypothetical protein PLC53_03555, partial [Bacilli bacterium]|nr:hypothetical protein [Bacilli bacterium]